MDCEFHFIPLTECIWDIHLQSSISLEIYIYCPKLKKKNIFCLKFKKKKGKLYFNYSSFEMNHDPAMLKTDHKTPPNIKRSFPAEIPVVLLTNNDTNNNLLYSTPC